MTSEMPNDVFIGIAVPPELTCPQELDCIFLRMAIQRGLRNESSVLHPKTAIEIVDSCTVEDKSECPLGKALVGFAIGKDRD